MHGRSHTCYPQIVKDTLHKTQKTIGDSINKVGEIAGKAPLEQRCHTNSRLVIRTPTAVHHFHSFHGLVTRWCNTGSGVSMVGSAAGNAASGLGSVASGGGNQTPRGQHSHGHGSSSLWRSGDYRHYDERTEAEVCPKLGVVTPVGLQRT